MRRSAASCLIALCLVGGCGPKSRSNDNGSRLAAPRVGSDSVFHSAPSTRALPTTRATTEPAPSYSAERFRLVNQKDEIVSALDNGLTVIAKRVSSPVVSARAYVHTGGVYEGPWLGGGLSHLLEHLVAGGTNDRRTEAQNRDLLQRLGNDSNAYTTTDHTAYFVNTTTDHMAEAVDLVAGWVLGAKITPEEYRREYEVVQRELEMGKGEPDRQLEYLSDLTRYRVSPARVPVIGYQEVIQGLSRDDVYSYYKQAYQPNNMIFAVAGDIDPEQMLAAVRANFAAAPAGRVFNHDIAEEPPVVAPRTSVATFPALGQARLKLGFPTVHYLHPDLFALDLLAVVLGGGDSSLLVEEVRDHKQLVSEIAVSSSTPSYVDGTFEILLQLDPAKVGAATDAVLEELERVKAGEIDDKRIERAKALVRANRVRQMQTSEDVVSSMATDLLTTGDPHFSDRYVRQMQEVSAVQLATVARRYLDRGRLLTTALLPSEYVGAAGLPKAEDLIRPAAPTTRPATEQPGSQIVRSELPDGTVLLAKRISTSPLVVVQMISLGGLSAESDRTNGLGNLAMEMLPRGTTHRSAQEIASFFDSIGGELNTGMGERKYGGNNSWYWTASCLKDDLPKALEVFADIVYNPAFPDGEIESMKRRVLADIAGQDADWLQQALRFFRKSYYGPMHSPYQFIPVGTPENVSAFTQDQMREWYAQKVLTGRRVLAIFGDVEPAAAKALAAELLSKGPKRTISERRASSTRPVATRSAATQPAAAFVDVDDVDVQRTGQALAGVLIGYRADTYYRDPANTPIAVADTMTSGYGYPTGYLHEILRGRGLVYVVHAVNSPGRDPSLPGTFFAYAGCDPKNVNEVVDVILENIARLQGTPQDVNEDWFDRSKELAVVSDALERQTPGDQAAAAALDELFGLGYDYHLHFADRIKAVSLPDVRNVARERLTRCVVTVSTPAPEAVKVKKGRREYSSFPPVDLTPRGVQHDAGH